MAKAKYMWRTILTQNDNIRIMQKINNEEIMMTELVEENNIIDSLLRAVRKNTSTKGKCMPEPESPILGEKRHDRRSPERWTVQDYEYLKSNYGRKSIKEIVQALNTNRTRVCNKISKMRLRKCK